LPLICLLPPSPLTSLTISKKDKLMESSSYQYSDIPLLTVPGSKKRVASRISLNLRHYAAGGVEKIVHYLGGIFM